MPIISYAKLVAGTVCLWILPHRTLPLFGQVLAQSYYKLNASLALAGLLAGLVSLTLTLDSLYPPLGTEEESLASFHLPALLD